MSEVLLNQFIEENRDELERIRRQADGDEFSMRISERTPVVGVVDSERNNKNLLFTSMPLLSDLAWYGDFARLSSAALEADTVAFDPAQHYLRLQPGSQERRQIEHELEAGQSPTQLSDRLWDSFFHWMEAKGISIEEYERIIAVGHSFGAFVIEHMVNRADQIARSESDERAERLRAVSKKIGRLVVAEVPSMRDAWLIESTKYPFETIVDGLRSYPVEDVANSALEIETVQKPKTSVLAKAQEFKRLWPFIKAFASEMSPEALIALNSNGQERDVLTAHGGLSMMSEPDQWERFYSNLPENIRHRYTDVIIPGIGHRSTNAVSVIMFIAYMAEKGVFDEESQYVLKP